MPITPTRNILVLGAGKSATVLIDYICTSHGDNWQLLLADADLKLATAKIKDRRNAKAIALDIRDAESRGRLIAEADIVISMLPPQLHSLAAIDCLQLRKNLLTASYADKVLQNMTPEIQKAGLLFLCEMGLDPGIDHMSAMKVIDAIHAENGQVTSFRSYCGGLVAPESDNNPWHYKISWNPANIVNAGKTGARYRENGKLVTCDHPRVFEALKTISCPDGIQYAAYPNRDSLPYATIYGLQQVPDFLRGTLRHPNFCTGWQSIIATGLTSSDPLPDQPAFSQHPLNTWFSHCLRHHTGFSDFSTFLKSRVPATQQRLVKELFDFLGLNSPTRLNINETDSPAGILQRVLEDKLRLQPGDRDLVVMQHEIRYRTGNKARKYTGCLKVTGENDQHTAMAKTVGLPLGIAAGLVLEGKIQLEGLQIPVKPAIYQPVMEALKRYKIEFEEFTEDED